MDNSCDLPINPDEIFTVESLNDTEILTDPTLCLLILGQENPDEVGGDSFLDLESFLFGGHSADNTREGLYSDFIFDVDPQHGQTVPASGLEEMEFEESNSGLNLDVVLQHGPTISESVGGYEVDYPSDFYIPQFGCGASVNIENLDFDSNVEPQLRQKGPQNDNGSTLQMDGFGQEKRAKAGSYDEVIAANKEYCAALEKFQEELNERKSLLEKRRRLLEEEIWRLKTNAGEKTKRLSFSQFGYPYFKDKNGKAMPVYEEALRLNKILHFEPSFDIRKPKVLPKQEEKLNEVLMRHLMRIALNKLTSARENVKIILTEKAAKGFPHKTFLNKLESLDKKIQEVNVNPQKWFKDPSVFNLIDWEKIASEVFPNQIGYDGVFLRQWWRVQLDPSFERGQLTAKEIEWLKKIAKCNPVEFVDFKAIATQMATELKTRKRHVFQLFRYYQRKLNRKNRTFGWPKAEVERLRVLHEEVSTNNNKRQEKWNKMRPAFPGRSVSQMETKLRRLSPKPASSPAKCLPTAIQAVVTPSKTPRGRPKKPEKSALDLKIAKLLSLHKSIRQGRRRITSLPGDGRRNGMILSAIQRLLPLKTDQGKIPREASELVAAGVAEKDVGAVEVMLSLPQSNLNSKISFPANLASLTGLRGLMLSLEGISQSVEVEIEQGISETEVNETCCLGDPVEDQKLLFALEKCFGSWARPFFDIETPVDGRK